jgi:hypothetical protein
MAKLPPIDTRAHWIRDALNRGDRPHALQLLEAALKSGKPGKETIALAEYLRTAKRGRQPFGSKHLWYDIGRDNDELRGAGVPYDERLQRLSLAYHLNDQSKLKTAIAKYEAAMEAVRAIDREETGGS